jgi:hypothetical protein
MTTELTDLQAIGSDEDTASILVLSFIIRDIHFHGFIIL